MSNKIYNLTHSNVDTSKIDVKQFNVNKDASSSYRSAYVNYLYSSDASSQFRYQINNKSLILPVNYSEVYNNHSLLIPLDDSDYEALQSIEETVIEQALPFCQQELDLSQKNKKNKKILSDTDFTSILRSADEEKGYKPSMSLKFKNDQNTGKFYCTLLDTDGKTQLKFTTDNYSEYLKKGCTIDMILTCTVYKLAEKFGITWRVSKIRIREHAVSSQELDFNDNSDDDAEFNDSTEATEQTESVSKLNINETEDSDDSDEEINKILSKGKPAAPRKR